jgi:hypothetical protein
VAVVSVYGDFLTSRVVLGIVQAATGLELLGVRAGITVAVTLLVLGQH